MRTVSSRVKRHLSEAKTCRNVPVRNSSKQVSELQTHPNLHSPVTCWSNGGPIWVCLFLCGCYCPGVRLQVWVCLICVKRGFANSGGLGARCAIKSTNSRATKRGGFKRGGFPDLDLSFLFCPFPIWGFSRFVLLLSLSLSLGLSRAPTRNSPERVRDAIWTFPEKSGKPAGMETPRFSFVQPMFRL